MRQKGDADLEMLLAYHTETLVVLATHSERSMTTQSSMLADALDRCYDWVRTDLYHLLLKC